MKNSLYKFVAFALLAPITALAVSFNGRVLKTDGTPINSGVATFTLQVYNPTLDCQLYSESKTYDFTDSQGVFSIELGSGTRLDSGAHQFTQIFSDGFTKSAGSNCSSGYTKSKGDKLILKSIFDDGQNPAFALNNVKIDYSPYSIDASSVAGIDSQNVLRVNGQQASPLSTSDYSQFLNLINGTSTLYAKNGASGVHVTGFSGNPSSPTVGDLWYDTTSNQLKYYDGSVKQVGQGSAPVTSVAGKTGAITLTNSDISGLGTSSIKDVPASGNAGVGEVVLGSDTRLTDSRTPTGSAGGDLSGTYPNPTLNTITTPGKVSGNSITSGTIGGSTVFSSSGNVQTTGTVRLYDSSPSNFVGFKAPASVTTSYTLTLPPSVSSGNGYVLSSDTFGNLSWTNPLNGVVTGVSGTAPVTVGGTSSAPVIGIDAATTLSSGVVTLSSNGGTTAGTVVQATDSRLTNSRTPTGSAGGDLSGTYPSPSVSKVQGTGVLFSSLTSGQFLKYDGSNIVNSNISTSDISGLGTAATKNFPVAGNAGIGEVVLGSDTRLTDSRVPAGSAGGDLSGTYPNPTLATTGVGAGTYKSVTVDTKGRVTSGSNPTTLSGFGITDAILGDTTVPSIKAGVIASRPASETEGSVYFSTDENKIYQYNTGAWAILGSATGSGGTVTSVTSANSDISVSSGTTTPSITLNSGTGSNQIVKLDATGKLPALNASLLTSISSSQVSFGSQAARYAFIAPSTSGTPSFRPLTMSDIFSSVTGSFLTGAASCPSGQMLTYLSPSDTLTCQPYSLTAAQVNAAMPDQSSNSGKYLKTDGTNISWDAPVTSVASANSDIVVSNGTTTPSLTLNSGTGANQIVKLDTGGKLPAVDGSQLTSISGTNLSGLVKVGADVSASCSTAGLTRYNNTTLEVCDGSAWKTMSTLTSAAGAISATLIKGTPQSNVGPGGTKITFQSTGSNTQGQASTANSRISAGTAGSYLVILNVTISSNSGNNNITTFIQKNSGSAIALSYANPGDNRAFSSNLIFTIDLIANDYIEAYVMADAGTFTISSSGYFTLIRIPSSSTTAGVDSVIEKYELVNPGYSSTGSAYTVLKNFSKVFGSATSMNLSTGVWTAPDDGTYEISGIFTLAVGSNYNAGSEMEVHLFYGPSNTLDNLCITYLFGAAMAAPSCGGTSIIKLRQGETFTLKIWQNLNGGDVAFTNLGRVNRFTVKRIGDY